MTPVSPLISPDDPRLSAYVLGELPPDEALLLEALIARSPEASATVADLRSMAALLRSSFAAELRGAKEDKDTSLALVEPAAGAAKVVAFSGQAERGAGRFPGRKAAAAAAMAAALALAAFQLPRGQDPVGSAAQAGSGGQPEWSGEEGTLIAAIGTGFGEERELSGVPDYGYEIPVGGVHFVSALQSQAAEEAMLSPRPLAADPTITHVRFLSDDPGHLSGVPVPVELLSYLPDTARGGGEPGRGTPVIHAVRGTYLDSERYPNPEIVGGREDGADRGRSLFLAESRFNAGAASAVGATGMALPERSAGLPLGRGEAAASGGPADLAARYVGRQQEQMQRAAALGDRGRRLLASGEFAEAASALEMALELLPEAPATENLRQRYLTWLGAASVALAAADYQP